MDDVDIIIEDNFTVFMLHPMTERARDWLAYNLPDSATWWKGAVAVEPETLPDLLVQLTARCLRVRGPASEAK